MSKGYRRVLPFRRSLKLIFLLLLLDLAFLAPAIAVFSQAASGWSQYSSLFGLVMAVFLSAWLLGWSIVPLLLSIILLVLVFGRESIRAKRGRLEIFLGLPLLGISSIYEPGAVRNLRLEQAPQNSGRSWRGSHLVFDYGANRVEFGSALTGDDAAGIKSAIEVACGTVLRSGGARPDELNNVWEPDFPDAQHSLLGQPSSSKPEDDGLEQAALSKRFSLSILLLILANLVPIAGMIFWTWDLADVMVLYWCESAIIGFYNLCKIVVAGRWAALLTGPFFLAHFSAFMAVHFLFIYIFFVEGVNAEGGTSAGDLTQVAQLFVSLWPALLALFCSHGYSFSANYLGRQEFRDRAVKDQMAEPYQRIIYMHLVLIVGGGLTLALGSPTPVLLLVIALKVWVDIRAHIKQHALIGNSA